MAHTEMHQMHATFSLKAVHCLECAQAVEQALQAQPHVTSVDLDWQHDMVDVGYHHGMVTPEILAQVINATGCDCAPADDTAPDTPDPGAHTPTPDSASPQLRMQQLKHGADMHAITLGTKHDRMQYELPATGAHAHHTMAAATPALPAAPIPPVPPMDQMDHATHATTATAQPTPPETMDHSAHAGMSHDMAASADMIDHSDHAGMSHGMAESAAPSTMDHSAHAGMGHDMSDPNMAASMEGDIRTKFLIALPLTILTVLLSPMGPNIFGITLPTFGINMNVLMLLLTTPVVWYCGWMFIGGAYQSLRRRMLNMSVLIAVGVLAAYLGSIALMVLGQETFFEAGAMLVSFVLFGHWMEMRSRRGMNDAMRALFDLVPPQATILRDGVETTIPSADVQVNDIVILKPGDKIPVDGVVTTGETSIDESLVTGESIPITKREGDPVIAGSLNRSGSIRFRALKVGADTTLAQIADLVQKAQRSKAPGQRLADQAAQYLVVAAVGIGLLTFLIWFLVLHASLAVALTFAISAIVIACPDALGLATPTAVAVGTGVAARHNILIKDAATLEGLAGMTAIILDKTGTLTEGKPALTDVIAATGQDQQAMLRLLASAERGSEHPLAEAIVNGAEARGLTLADASAFESIAGYGIRATVDGHVLLAGNQALMGKEQIDVAALSAPADTLAAAGKTPMYVALDSQAAGLVAVADTVKPNARAAIRRFGELGIDVVMITGDNQRTAATIATNLGIPRFFAEVLPADKARHVQELQREGKRVAMVGDGVNDAPALAQADIGIAIGAGTDVAIQTANIVLMRSDPLDIVNAIMISQATVRKMKQNLFWAAIYNVLAIPVAAGLFYPSFGIVLRPEWSALLMSISSIIVALNAVALKRVERTLDRPSVSAGDSPALPVPTP